MSATLLAGGLIALFSAASIYYVYAHRGNYRHSDFRVYSRKCWPMFAPLNCLLYLSTERRARSPILDLADFPELAEIRENWQTIRDEALALQQDREFERISSPDSKGYYDVGFHTFFKGGWSKYYVSWYGYTHHSARRTCPKTVEILSRIPSVNGALFTLLPPGAKLNPHSDPFACSLRYHLGLDTPNSDDCWIEVDKNRYSWRNGDALLFDETYVHHAANESGQPRLILMCDIARPMNIFGRLVNFIYRQFMRLTLVPNDESDRAGGFNALFSRVAPVLERGKRLKKTNRRLYKTIKHAINLTVLVLVVGALGWLISLLMRLASA